MLCNDVGLHELRMQRAQFTNLHLSDEAFFAVDVSGNDLSHRSSLDLLLRLDDLNFFLVRFTSLLHFL